jgi:hypothetical protein
MSEARPLTRKALRARLVAEAERQADRLAKELGLPDDDGEETPAPKQAKITPLIIASVERRLARRGRLG